MPPQCGRAPAPPKAIFNVEYCLVDCVLPGEMDGKLSLLLCFFIFQEWEMEDRRRGGGQLIQGQEIKKEVWVSG